MGERDELIALSQEFTYPSLIWARAHGETRETVTDYFLGLQKSLHMVTAAIKLKDACSLEEKL